jgi:hypothetical protein
MPFVVEEPLLSAPSRASAYAFCLCWQRWVMYLLSRLCSALLRPVVTSSQRKKGAAPEGPRPRPPETHEQGSSSQAAVRFLNAKGQAKLHTQMGRWEGKAVQILQSSTTTVCTSTARQLRRRAGSKKTCNDKYPLSARPFPAFAWRTEAERKADVEKRVIRGSRRLDIRDHLLRLRLKSSRGVKPLRTTERHGG